MTELWQPLLLFGCGIAAGFINVMAGGGSMLTLPVMVFMGLPGPVANGTNRVATVAQNIAAVAKFTKEGYSDFKLGLSLALATIPGAAAGALVGVRLGGVWFNRVLAAVMLLVMIFSWRRKHRSPRRQTQSQPGHQYASQAFYPSRLLWSHAGMVLVGFYGGFIQVGVGFLLIAVLHQVLGLDFVRVNMHKVFIAGVFNVVALLVYAINVPVAWLIGCVLATGTAVGGWLGAKVSVKRGEKTIRWVLNVVLMLFIVKLLTLGGS